MKTFERWSAGIGHRVRVYTEHPVSNAADLTAYYCDRHDDCFLVCRRCIEAKRETSQFSLEDFVRRIKQRKYRNTCLRGSSEKVFCKNLYVRGHNS